MKVELKQVWKKVNSNSDFTVMTKYDFEMIETSPEDYEFLYESRESQDFFKKAIDYIFTSADPMPSDIYVLITPTHNFKTKYYE